ncbi:MAG: hypothetical protein JWO05_48 [Gemmatimonadetes bacterium]|nr:hypothetical protein [Gemmatimonadota bacterium]
MRILRCLAVLALALPIARAVAQDTPAQFDARYAAITAAKGADAARLKKLLALDWEYLNVTFPENATYNGYPGQDDRWSDNSLAAFERYNKEMLRPLRAIRSIDRDKLSAGDQLNYDLFLRQSQLNVEGTKFPSELLAVSQEGGPQQYVVNLFLASPHSTVADYENLLKRLESAPAVFTQTRELLEKGLADKVTPPAVTLRDVPRQVDDLLTSDPMASPLLLDFRHMPEGMSQEDRDRLTSRAVSAFHALEPALHDFRDYLANTYIPGARESIGMSELPNGKAWYAYKAKVQTTTGMTPKEIHALGLKEVARIRTSMDSLISAVGFHGDFQAFVHFLRTDPQFFFTDSASLVRAYRDIVKRIDPELPRIFGKLPRLTYGVATIPSSSAPSVTTAYYQQGAPDVGRAGTYFVNTYKLDARPKWEMEALSMHESVPGHHLQIALAQELEGVPEFRRYGGTTAFIEGWGLYAESLGGEIGLYTDPYSRFGQMTYEMWRAIRLVLDTGLHEYGWSRDSAIAYFKANSAKTETDIVNEVDRYINDPGQALAYKIGQLRIRGLRTEAEKSLGAKFDERAFHDVVLGGGAVPLDVLEKRVREWVGRTKRTAK